MNALEIIVETLEDAQAAEAGGATQLDLKAHYPCSGITPSLGMVKLIHEKVSIPIVMMIRPHARSFQASQGDIQAACNDIYLARDLGVSNFMAGFLTPEKRLDTTSLKQLLEAVGDAHLHMHLAWELTKEPFQTLDEMVEIGLSSIHTGGLSTAGSAFGGSALDAAENIRHIAEHIQDRMDIFLAGSVSTENAADLIQATGITNLHCGRGVRTPPSAEGLVDVEKVRALRQAQCKALGLKE